MVLHRRAALLGSIFAGLVLVISSLGMSMVAAATSTGGQGLRVSPVVTNLTINAGETQTVSVNVQNVTGSTLTLQAVINDFVAASNNETGEPSLLLNPNQYAPTHSLKRYVNPIPNVTLQPNEQKTVTVSITIPKDISGGGYFGAVRFVPVTGSSGNNISLSASVASLILVRVPGNFKEQVNIASFDVRSGTNGTPRVIFTGGKGLVAEVRLNNVGDVQEQPFGKVILESGKKVLGSYELNNTDPRGNVLPDSIRMFTVNLANVGSFGKYTVLGNFGYGTNGQLVSGQTTFYVIPLGLILAVVAVIIIVLFLIFGFPRLKRRYDQRVLKRSRR